MDLRRIGIVLAVMAVTPLAGCGFTPLYASPGGAVTPLRSIELVTPESRTGFLLRQHLDDALGRRQGEAPRYRMELQVGEARYPRGLRVDNVATRYEYVLTASYILTDRTTGSQAKQGSVRVELTYDSSDQPYASVMAQQDVADRAAEEAARRIQLELAAWFAQKSQGGAG